ncbi:hypothetical protein ALC57_16354, partial [Trachymyrmex cornetzi]
IPRASVGGTCVGEEGRKRRLGFGKKGKSSFTVHRSEEVLPPEDTVGGRSGRQPSSASSDGEGSGDGDRSDLLSLSRNTSLFFISLSLYFPHYFCIDTGAIDCGRGGAKEGFTSLRGGGRGIYHRIVRLRDYEF